MRASSFWLGIGLLASIVAAEEPGLERAPGAAPQARPTRFAAYVTPAVWFDAVPERDARIDRLLEGAAILGVSILDDRAGDDVYRVPELGIGIAFVGVAVLVDRAGNDEYASAHLAQGFGLGRGLGALVDLKGNDRYACTGRRPWSHGTTGVFDG